MTAQRLKIVVSDFHLGAGRLGADGAVNDVEDFISDQAFCDLMEYYRTGEYFDAEVELVLNGDIFETLGLVDPSDPDPSMITVGKSLKKIDRILDGHKELFSAMRTFAAGERRQVTFTVGNHDQELLWREVQERLQERIHPDVRVITDVYRFDGVHLEHGAQHDPHNRLDPNKMFLTKGLPEPVLHLSWGSDFFINCLLRLKQLRPYVNRVRPFRMAIWWSIMHDFRFIFRGFIVFLVALFKARFRKHRQRRITFLATLRLALQGGEAYPTLEDAAKKVLDADPHTHTVIFGHTHIPMRRQLYAGRSYLNSGSWIPNSNLHISALGRSLLQTYVFIEYDGDRPIARLKLWHGRRRVEEEIAM